MAKSTHSLVTSLETRNTIDIHHFQTKFNLTISKPFSDIDATGNKKAETLIDKSSSECPSET